MAFDKLHEGIKKFAEDGKTLKNVLLLKLEGLISVGVRNEMHKGVLS
jgi:hypothetical protein